MHQEIKEEPYDTVNQIAKRNSKEAWYNNWMSKSQRLNPITKQDRLLKHF